MNIKEFKTAQKIWSSQGVRTLGDLQAYNEAQKHATSHASKKAEQVIKQNVKMALGVNDDLILLTFTDKQGLFIGSKKNYATLGTYTASDLIKLCNNENNNIIYLIYTILNEADKAVCQNSLLKLYNNLEGGNL